MQKQAVVLGFAACVLLVSAWFFAAEAGVVLITAGGIFGWLVRHISQRAPAPAPIPAGVAEAADKLHVLEAKTSSLRHDLRGILSPAYLTAERLLTHADPQAKRAGEMMIKTIERASARLNETKGM